MGKIYLERNDYVHLLISLNCKKFYCQFLLWKQEFHFIYFYSLIINDDEVFDTFGYIGSVLWMHDFLLLYVKFKNPGQKQ